MTDLEVQSALAGISTLALTMWGEARGDWRQGNSSVEERIAVGCVIRNRVTKAGPNGLYHDICFAPHQFSCWDNVGGANSNYSAVMALARNVVAGIRTGDAVYEETAYLASGIIGGTILDRTNGATSYYAPKAMVPPGRVPSWAQNKQTIQIGEQLFL